MNTYEEVTKIFQSKTKGYFDIGESLSAKHGLRVVEISGDALRDAIRTNSIDMLINLLFMLLPKDAAIIDHDGQQLRLANHFAPDGSGCHRDCFILIVASDEWDRPEEGGIIKRLQFYINAQLIPVE